MRSLSFLPLALLAGCAASGPVAKAPAPKPAALVSTASNTQQQFARIDESNLAKAQAAGYKVVDENGKKLYCRRSLVTGTRLHYTTECLTAEELQRLDNANKDYMNHGPGINYNGPNGG